MSLTHEQARGWLDAALDLGMNIDCYDKLFQYIIEQKRKETQHIPALLKEKPISE